MFERLELLFEFIKELGYPANEISHYTEAYTAATLAKLPLTGSGLSVDSLSKVVTTTLQTTTEGWARLKTVINFSCFIPKLRLLGQSTAGLRKLRDVVDQLRSESLVRRDIKDMVHAIDAVTHAIWPLTEASANMTDVYKKLERVLKHESLSEFSNISAQAAGHLLGLLHSVDTSPQDGRWALLIEISKNYRLEIIQAENYTIKLTTTSEVPSGICSHRGHRDDNGQNNVWEEDLERLR